MKLRHYLTVCSALLLASCQTSCQTTGQFGPQSEHLTSDRSEDGMLFGEYLAGSYANYIDKSDARSQYYSRAFARADDDISLGRRALTSALTAGDLELTRKTASDIHRQDAKEPMALAILGIQAFEQGRHNQAQKLLTADTGDLTMGILMGLVKGWNYVAQGDIETARQTFEEVGGGSYFDALAHLQIAKAEAMQGNIEAAKEAFKLAEDSGQSPIEMRLSKARFLYNIGENDLALELLEAFSQENDNIETGPIRGYIDRLKAGQPIDGLYTPKQEAARALTQPAYGFFVANRARDAGEVFLRLALTLDPGHDKAGIWLGNLLENTEREDEAMTIYESMDPSSDYIVSAKLAQANVWFSREKDDQALKVLEAVNKTHPSFTTRESLGRARLIDENYADALPIYDALVKSMSDEELKINTQPLYFRGICYEREKQWASAEADFKRVLEIEPDNADALNYLGYTWVDRGENLTEAFSMINKALELDPNSGAITDSLGWAHYKLGQYSEAKTRLEDAVVLAPSSATIIDHLGDVYWKLGRFREAGYQWERALEFDPTDEERAAIRTKLKGGLEAAQALP